MSGIGVAIFICEGVGVILPIKELVEKKENYTKDMVYALSFYGLIVIAFGLFSLYGYKTEDLILPLVTECMPRKSYIGWLIKMLYCIVVILTFPL